MPNNTQLPDAKSHSADERLDAANYHRNIEPILGALRTRLPTTPGHILEVGSGTGQHVTSFAQQFPMHTWHPTDLNQESLASIRAWTDALGLTNVAPPISLDASSVPWPVGADGQPPMTLDGIFSANVIHISPWSVTQGILSAAGRHLRAGTSAFLYGPFMRDGVHTAPSNAAFDQSLRARNDAWGVRDLADLETFAKSHALTLVDIVDMPANNFVVEFKRA